MFTNSAKNVVVTGKKIEELVVERAKHPVKNGTSVQISKIADVILEINSEKLIFIEEDMSFI
jgi:co-chaperonin GroES (HSP10)